VALPRSVRLRDGRAATIRPARPEDAEAWIRNTNAIGAEGIYLMLDRLNRTLEQVRVQFRDANPSSELWLVAEIDGTVVAGANWARGSSAKNAHTASLGVAVRSEYRHLGLGRALMEEGIAWARSVGISKLKLGVFSTNAAAIALYRKLGFEEEGRLRSEVIIAGAPVDEILMSLFLEGRPSAR